MKNQDYALTNGNSSKQEILYIQMSNQTKLDKAGYLSLSRLIYDTDPYIYPAMFGRYENAEILLPLLFRNNDAMFCLDNCYVATRSDKIIGLLLWKKGVLDWTPSLLKQLSEENGIEVSQYLDVVAEEYVANYKVKLNDSLVSLINLCVNNEYRGQGIGRKILESFFDRGIGNLYELCALQDNRNAVHLYESLGFVSYEKYNGFSIDHRNLPALRMRRCMR